MLAIPVLCNVARWLTTLQCRCSVSHMRSQPPANQSEVASRLTLPAAAQYLGVSEDTIRRRIKDGTLPAVLIAGRYRISQADLDLMVSRREAA